MVKSIRDRNRNEKQDSLRGSLFSWTDPPLCGEPLYFCCFRISVIGTPQEIYFEPKTPFVADFIGTTNLLSVTGGEGGRAVYGGVSIPAARQTEAGKAYAASIRPECIQLFRDPQEGMVNIPAVITNSMFLGEKVRYFIRDREGKDWIVDMFDPGRDIHAGEVYAVFPAEKLWLMDAEA